MQRIILVTMFVVSFMAMGIVNAETLEYTQSYSGSPDWTQTLSVPKISSSAGTLNSVSIQISNSGSASLSYQNNTTSSKMGTLGFDFIWEVTLADDTSLFSDTKEWNLMWYSDGGESYSAGPYTFSVTQNTTNYSSAADLAYFIGSGSANFIASGSEEVTGCIHNDNYSNGNFLDGEFTEYNISTPSSLGIIVEVTYDYTPAPEPSSVTLLVVAMIGLLVRARISKN